MAFEPCFIYVAPPVAASGPCMDVTCSGRGTCSNLGICFCDEGYSGDNCQGKNTEITGNNEFLESLFWAKRVSGKESPNSYAHSAVLFLTSLSFPSSVVTCAAVTCGSNEDCLNGRCVCKQGHTGENCASKLYKSCKCFCDEGFSGENCEGFYV